jgi:hypothetical protein
MTQSGAFQYYPSVSFIDEPSQHLRPETWEELQERNILVETGPKHDRTALVSCGQFRMKNYHLPTFDPRHWSSIDGAEGISPACVAFSNLGSQMKHR